MTSKQQYELLGKINSSNLKKDRNLIVKALSHLDRLNKEIFSSEKKVKENLETAIILAELKAEPATIVAALLCSKRLSKEHLDEIKEEFGEEVAFLIENKTRFEHAIKSAKNQKTSIELRKILFFSLTNNVNLILLVIADRLSLLRKINTLLEEDKKDLILEQEEILIPIAHKLGIFNIKSEAEDLIFKYKTPEKYYEILKKAQKEKGARKKAIERISTILTKKAKEKNTNIRISGRAKSIYSTYVKIIRKNKPIEEIHDIVALRVICDSVKNCYEMLGVVHSLWKPRQEEFDDYITKPKPNNYRALHTTVMGSDNKSFEIQIKTQEMHNNAEFGMAAHWKYKGHTEQKLFDKKIRWLNELLSWQKELKEAPAKSAKVDFFGENIYVLSPKGDIIELPKGATVLDFSYAIHNELGNKCAKAKVNQKVVPLNHKLETADMVEIITSFSQKPKMNWLNFVVTTKAKNSIKQNLDLYTLKSKKPLFVDKKAIKTTDKRIKIAKCCLPVPGDKIVGFRTTKRKISVHRVDCKEILKFPEAKQTSVSWDLKKKLGYAVDIKVIADDRAGLLRDILGVFSKYNVTVLNAKANLGHGETANCLFEIQTKNLNELERTIEKLRDVNTVKTVERV